MHVFGLGLHVIVALLFAVHAVRSGQPLYWLLILFLFPGLGSLVYGVAVWWPEVRNGRTARRLSGGVRGMLDPDRELREAQAAYESSPSVDNRLRLAAALSANGRAADAVPQLRAALEGVHRDDPSIQVRLALALLDSNDAAGARTQLESLRAAHPSFRSDEGHLIYARALAALDDRARAREEFDALVSYYAGFEPSARYAELLRRWGESGDARRVVDVALRRLSRLPRHVRELNRPWVDSLERLARELP